MSAAIPSGSPTQGRLFAVAAALLWSTSGLFTRVLQQPTVLHVDQPTLEPAQIAFYRVLFAGLFFVPLLRRRDLEFRPAMPFMVLTFASMNWLFISAMALGTAANAIWLQYTAPIWMVLFAVFVLGESLDRRTVTVLMFGMLGVFVILMGGWRTGPGVGDLPVVGMALGSGVTYAGVLIFLRALRDCSGRFLTAINHVGGALCLLPFVWSLAIPTPSQLAFLMVFGVLQLGLAYWLMSRSLRMISPQEAGMIALLEPILTPIWAYLIAPEREMPPVETWIGASLILTALIWRYGRSLRRRR